MDVKNFTKGLNNSLKFLDNQYIYYTIVVILFLYNSLLFMNINDFFSNVYKFGIIRVIVLLLILYTSQKCYLISLLLAMSYILSIYFDREKVSSTENFFNNEENDPQGINDMLDNNNSLTYESEKINPNRMINDQNMVNFNNTPESFSNGDEEEDKPENFSSENELENNYESFFNQHEEEDNHESFSNNMSEEEYESFSDGIKTHKNEKTIEGIPEKFFSGMSKEQFDSFKTEHSKPKKMIESMTNKNENNSMNNALSKTECLQNYNPRFESIGNICEPVATFENEFNAQGLNYPIGYNIK